MPPARDHFARELARRATETAREAAIVAQEALERATEPRDPAYGRCKVCGDPARPTVGYCHAHSWMAG